MPVVAPVDHDENLASGDEAVHPFGISLRLGNPDPKQIHGCPQLPDRDPCLSSNERPTSVGADDEPAPSFEPPARRAGAHTHHAVVLEEELSRFGLHQEVEPGVESPLAREELKEVPLRHERHEPAPRG